MAIGRTESGVDDKSPTCQLHEASKLLDISIGRKEKVVGSFDSNQYEYIQFDKLLINDLITLELKFFIYLLKILSSAYFLFRVLYVCEYAELNREINHFTSNLNCLLKSEIFLRKVGSDWWKYSVTNGK